MTEQRRHSLTVRVRHIYAAAMLAASSLLVAAPPVLAAPLQTACPEGTLAGTTYTLTADCAVTEPLTVPDGFTLDGGGFIISATDAGGPQWNGPIVTNAAGATSMNIQNVTVTGPEDGFQLCGLSGAGNILYGIFFNDAGGNVSNVTVDHIFQQQDGTFASCQTGRAIRADGLTPAAPRTVTITGTTVRDYQKSAFESRGSMTMNLTGSTAGPPHPLEGLNAQNAISFVNTTSGTVANNTIHGSSDQAPGPPGCGNCFPANGTGMLLSNADNATVTGNTFVGLGTDIGIAVSTADPTGSTGNIISFNDITRTDSTNPDNTDSTGFGINVDPGSSATLICNTFSGWNQNIVGAIQVDCTPLPDGAECEPYSAQAPTVQGGIEGENAPPLTWALETGSLPPGLTLATDGTISGTPTGTGTFDFTLMVTDADGLTATSDQTITIAPGCASPTPTPSQAPSAAPTGAGLPDTAVDRRQPITGADLTLLAASSALLAAVVVLTAVAGRRRRAQRH